jgi:ketosteroid isomerase-like protein
MAPSMDANASTPFPYVNPVEVQLAPLFVLMNASPSPPAKRIAVQVYGDVAILTYNYVGINKDKDGKFQPVRAKSTRVFAKQSGKWMLVHRNFGSDPLPK